MPSYIATLRCPDRAGIIHAMTGALLQADANILEQAQFTDEDSNLFCMRTRFETPRTELDDILSLLTTASGAVGNPKGATHDTDNVITLRGEDAHRRIVILVSQYDHCLADLLYRHDIGDLPVDIPTVMSNHETCRDLVERHDIAFVHMPVFPETKAESEQRIRDLVAEYDIDAIVLARYMQILSEEFCADFPGRIINIHHSFLPGFKGARPYHQAHERGVKLIGATAHFVTADLDEGPIIEQEVVRVSHAQSANDLASVGRDVERQVLSRAVKLYAEDRIQLLGQRTVVFE